LIIFDVHTGDYSVYHLTFDGNSVVRYLITAYQQPIETALTLSTSIILSVLMIAEADWTVVSDELIEKLCGKITHTARSLIRFIRCRLIEG
jgi:hypothetical protein